MKGIKNRGTQVHGVHKCKPKFREYHDDLEYDRVEYLEKRDRDEWYEFIRKNPQVEHGY